MANIAKYFWDLNAKALKETKAILKDINHPKFRERTVRLLSRCDKPDELFALISKADFIAAWPKIKSYWQKMEPESDFRNWWQTIYEQILARENKTEILPKGSAALNFIQIGREIRRARINKGFSQSDLALRAKMKQPDISKIEEGRKNVTLATLFSLCKVLGIEKINIKGD